jgi:chromosome segregation ATPase
MKDMVTMKQSIETLKSANQKKDLDIADLQRENEQLKQETQTLDLQNRKCEETFNHVRENFTKINDYFQGLVDQAEEKRTAFETNTSKVLGDLKVEVRYLSITVLDLNKHKMDVDKEIPRTIDEKYVQLSTRLSHFMENLNSSQNTILTSLHGKWNMCFVYGNNKKKNHTGNAI